MSEITSVPPANEADRRIATIEAEIARVNRESWEMDNTGDRYALAIGDEHVAELRAEIASLRAAARTAPGTSTTTSTTTEPRAC